MSRPKTQVCRTCLVKKPVSEYQKSNKSKSGHFKKCCECISLEARERARKRNMEDVKVDKELFTCLICKGYGVKQAWE